MDQNGCLNSLRREKFFALLVGFIVAWVHFVITFSMLILEKETYSIVKYLSEFISVVLQAPSIAPILMISDLLRVDFPNLDNFSPLSVLVIACSSAFYGITGSFLASNQKSLQRAGIVFISLLMLANCYVLVLIY